MLNPRCLCNVRSRGLESCPVHDPDSELLFLQELERNNSKRRKRRESTPLNDIEDNIDLTGEEMDELLTQLVNLNTTVANATQATNERVAQMIDEHSRVKIKEPKEFKGEDSYDINDFLGQFDRYCRLNRVADETKALLFSTYLEAQPLQFYESLDAAIKANFVRLRKSFIAEYNPENRKFHRRQKLSRRKMKETETVKDFYISLQTEARKLEYPEGGTLQVFMEGLAPQIKEHVLLQAPNTIEDAYRHAQAKESAMESMAEEEKSTTKKLLPVLNTLVHNLTENKSNNKKVHFAKVDNDSEIQKMKKRINELESIVRSASNVNRTTLNQPVCYNCGRIGHIARNCRQRQVQQQSNRYNPNKISTLQSRQLRPKPDGFNQNNTPGQKPSRNMQKQHGSYLSEEGNLGEDTGMTVVLRIEGEKHRFLVDTGASVSVVHPKAYSKWKGRVKAFQSVEVIETMNSKTRVLGEVYVDLDFAKFILTNQKLLVARCGEYEGILGRDFLRSTKALINVSLRVLVCYNNFEIPIDFDYTRPKNHSSKPAFSAVHKLKCYHNNRYIHHEKQQYKSTRLESTESNSKQSLQYKQTRYPGKSSPINSLSFNIEDKPHEASKRNKEVSDTPSAQLPKKNSEEEKSNARYLDSFSEVKKSVETSEAIPFEIKTNDSDQSVKKTDNETDQVSDTSRLNTQISPKETTLNGTPAESRTFFISKTQAKNLIFKFTSFVFSLLIIFRMVRVDFVQTDQNSKARNNYGMMTMKVFNYITGSLSSKVLKVSLLSRVTSDIVAIFRCHTCGPGNSDKLILTL